MLQFEASSTREKQRDVIGRDESREIVRLVERLGRISHSLQFAAGLNPAQWQTLRYIAGARRNSRSPGALACFLGNTRGSVSQTLKALEARGLIERDRKNDDRRTVRLRLTSAGRAMLRDDPLESMVEAITLFSEPDRRNLMDGMQRLLDAVQSYHGLPEFGGCTDCCHLVPDTGKETSGWGARCGISGEFLELAEIDRICTDFSRRPAQSSCSQA